MNCRALRRLAPALALALLPFQFSDARAEEGDTGKPATGVVSIKGIRLPDLDGNVVDLGTYLGKGPVLLDFWATWCKPCTVALPELNRLYTDLAPRGLQILGINEDGQRNASKVKPFVKTQGFKFPVVLDLNREAQSQLNVAVLPTTLLIDAEGKLVHTSFGYRPGEIDALREKIEPLLAAPPHE